MGVAPIRFWGTAVAVKPRLVLTRFENQTTAKCAGHLAVCDGTRTQGADPPAAGRFTVALGPATQQRRSIAPGDLLRGDAFPVPFGTPDVPADLYRVGVLRVLARVGGAGGARLCTPDPPRTDPPLPPDRAEAAPRRALAGENLGDNGPCWFCPYGVVVPIVRLSDPRDFKGGSWRRVPACLGPADCPHYAPPMPQQP